MSWRFSIRVTAAWYFSWSCFRYWLMWMMNFSR